MVRKYLLTLLLCLVPLGAFAANFTATVESDQITAGEPFELQLNLSGTSAKSDPDLSALEQSFTVAGQGETSSTEIINGAISSSTGWDLTLIPKAPGNLTIPAVTIDTDDGVLSTQPIALDAGQAARAVPSRGGGTLISASASAETLNPYKNQPVRYKVSIIAHAGVTDLAMDDLTVPNAIVDAPAKPKVSDIIRNGVPAKLIEYDYLITPLQPGPLAIPPATVHGDREVETGFRDPFAQDAFSGNPFQMMRNMQNFAAMATSRPFTIASNPVTLDVRPPAAAMKPWLPLNNLQIKDDWSGLQGAKVGEPLTRKIMVLADGTTGNVIPSLETQQNHTDFKVYADKAAIGNDNGGSDHVIGWRKESYTLIPQKSGQLTIPAIRVPWWDIAHDRIAYAELPARSIDVLPGVAAEQPLSSPNPSAVSVPQQTAASLAAPPRTDNQILYGIIAALLAVTGAVTFWAFRLRRKLSGQPVREQREETPQIKTLSRLPDTAALEQARTPEDVKNFIQNYASQHWGAPRNAPLEKAFSLAPSHIQEKAQAVIRDLYASLYLGRVVDLDSIKRQLRTLLIDQSRKKNKEIKKDKLSPLNPS